jgi:alkylation response protein AidB-like acyl-CoA dehydrogenase
MDFRVTSEQRELAQGVRAFCDRRVPQPRELEKGFDRALFRELADLGVFALRSPEKNGGLGRTNADAVLVFEELGRALVPGPVAWTHLAADFVAGARDGAVVVVGLEIPRAERKALAILEHPRDLDVLLVLRDDSVERIDAKTLDVRAVDVPLDPLTPVGLAESLPAGERIGGRDEARRMRLAGTTLVAAQLLGIAEATLALAVDYAKVREQFGRPIGAFQAIKHILADMFVRLEVARAAVYAAAATLDAPEVGDPARAVSVAKLHAGESAILNARACIQVHGGMGYTWEIPAHYFLKRAYVLESTFGTRDHHANALGESSSQGEMSTPRHDVH